MARAYYSATMTDFLQAKPAEIIGILTTNSDFNIGQEQRDAWLEEISILKESLAPYQGSIFFEYSIPRMGKRIDVVALLGPVIFALEFKAGETSYTSYAHDQVLDYALDLKNFHEPSHDQYVAPVLIATGAQSVSYVVAVNSQNDKLLLPIHTNGEGLASVLKDVLQFADGPKIDCTGWEQGRYSPTPTIVEAAMALYRGHSVAEISRSDASAINLVQTSKAVSKIIEESRVGGRKSICFVTGVPGAGKTLVGLNIATENIDKESDLYSVFLSGNGPLVAILREALARDRVQHEKERGKKITKSSVLSEVKMFIQNVHNFRDDCLVKAEQAPIEHVALFDEAQRAWNLEQTANFMKRKRNKPNFSQSEPEFLISCLDRHRDWAVVVCLVGGGQEINTGEAGIGEWIGTLVRSFPDWHIHISPRLTDSEYGAGKALENLRTRPNVTHNEDLHLAVSMRSFRAENVSLMVKQLLDLQSDDARHQCATISKNYPIALTRDVAKAKQWLKSHARGTERYGIIVSSQAERLRPHAIHVRAPMDPIHWFLDGKKDVRSSYYLEDVATEFDVQGLELDWACVTWDADFRYSPAGWECRSFCGDRWNHIRKKERQNYLKNAYRVLLTRARQGMVIVVPEGDPVDPTRRNEFYDCTFEYLRGIGFETI